MNASNSQCTWQWGTPEFIRDLRAGVITVPLGPHAYSVSSDVGRVPGYCKSKTQTWFQNNCIRSLAFPTWRHDRCHFLSQEEPFCCLYLVNLRGKDDVPLPRELPVISTLPSEKNWAFLNEGYEEWKIETIFFFETFFSWALGITRAGGFQKGHASTIFGKQLSPCLRARSGPAKRLALYVLLPSDTLLEQSCHSRTPVR